MVSIVYLCIFILSWWGVLYKVQYVIVNIPIAIWCEPEFKGFISKVICNKVNIGQLSKFFQSKMEIIYLSIKLNMCFGCSK